MVIELTKEQAEALEGIATYRKGSIEINGETFEYVDVIGQELHEDYRVVSHLFKRKNDGKLFVFDAEYVRYGYEDYGFEPDYIDKFELVEVELREVCRMEYVRIRD